MNSLSSHYFVYRYTTEDAAEIKEELLGLIFRTICNAGPRHQRALFGQFQRLALHFGPFDGD
jgi:hypothetical protein